MHHGAHISIGGFTLNCNPMAAVYEIIRQGFKGLYVYAHANGTGVDELIGGGCVDKPEIAYAGNGKTAATCIRFRQAVEQGTLLLEPFQSIYYGYFLRRNCLAGNGQCHKPTLWDTTCKDG